MSIFPATDLVSEVAHAADPQRLNAAVSRLAEMSATRLRSNEEFARLVDTAGESSRSRSGAVDSAAIVRKDLTPIATTRPAQASQPNDVTQKFEAYIIQTCLETVLPRSDQGLFGHGTAGGVWRSMVAEQIGNQIAKAGGVGLRKVLDGHWTQNKQTEPTSTASTSET